MRPNPSRIILYGHFGSGNIGNDSSLEAMLFAIRKYRPNAEVICICNGPDVIHERFGIETLEIAPSGEVEDHSPNIPFLLRLKRISRRIASEIQFWWKRPAWFQPGDQFIVVGTGMDDMAVKHPWNAPYELSKWCSVARKGGAQVAFLSVGVGPIVNRVSRFLILKALRTAQYRSYRETAAFEYLKTIGYDTTGDRLYPDLVFSLPDEALPVRHQTSASLTVGLGLINYQGWRHDPETGEKTYQDYLRKIKCFVSWLLDAGYVVRIISGDAIDQRPVQDVAEYVARERSSHQTQLIVEPIRDSGELLAQIAKTDIVIASRFHNVLCSLLLLRPVISLGYHAKNADLMSEMGLGAWCQPIEGFSVEKLSEQVLRCTVETTETMGRVALKNKQYKQLLEEQYRRILVQDRDAAGFLSGTE